MILLNLKFKNHRQSILILYVQRLKVQKLAMTEDVDSNILRRFDLQKKLGKGAYGIVWQVVEKDQRVERGRERLALKKCFNCFHNGDVDAQRTVSCIMLSLGCIDFPG